MRHIEIQNEQAYAVNAEQLQRAIQLVIDRHDIAADSGVTAVLTTNESVQALNLQHRQVDAPTDVLSFTSDPLPPELLDDEAPYLGDLVIAYPYARSQAERLNHSIADSLCLLVIHGTLHLLGYTHDTAENRADMWAEQAAALSALGISDAIVPALEESDHA